jgi:hypothetical protein
MLCRCKVLIILTSLLCCSATAQQWASPQRGWLYVLDVGGASGEGRVLLVDPVQGAIKGTLPTGYHPDFGTCSDGSRIYVVDGAQFSGFLTMFESQSGRLLNKSHFEDRAVYTIRPSQPGIGCSANGQWLFIQTMKTLTPGVDEHSIAVVDASTGQPLPRSIPLSGCGVAQFIQGPFTGWDIAVECSLTNSIRFIALDSAGAVSRVKDVALALADGAAPDGTVRGKSERMTSSTVFDSSSRSVVIARPAGGVDQLDLSNLTVVPKITDAWQRWAPRGGTISPNFGLFYLGFVPYAQRTQPGGLMNWIQ